jgi:hypothetical protein
MFSQNIGGTLAEHLLESAIPENLLASGTKKAAPGQRSSKN